MWMCVFVCVHPHDASASVCLCVFVRVLRAENRVGALTTDIYSYCLICQTPLALWVFNLLIRPQDPALFQKTTAEILISFTR